MNTSEIAAALKSVNVEVVPVVDLPDHKDDVSFEGSFENYLALLPALGARFVCLATIIINEGHFEVSGEQEDGLPRNQQGLIDLCKVYSSLTAMRANIGQAGHIDLVAPLYGLRLKYVLRSDWMEAFVEARSSAIEIVEARHAKMLEVTDEEIWGRVNEIKQAAAALVSDETFLSLPTQRAMVEYAKIHVPQFTDISEYHQRDAIRDLKAKLAAAGRLRK